MERGLEPEGGLPVLVRGLAFWEVDCGGLMMDEKSGGEGSFGEDGDFGG